MFYSILCLYRTWLYRNTYISLFIPEDSPKLNRNNLYESRDSYTGALFIIPEFFLSHPYKFFLSGINREYCTLIIFPAVLPHLLNTSAHSLRDKDVCEGVSVRLTVVCLLTEAKPAISPVLRYQTPQGRWAATMDHLSSFHPSDLLHTQEEIRRYRSGSFHPVNHKQDFPLY